MKALARRALMKLGLLDFTRALRRGFAPPEPEFRPCTPHLLIAVHRALRRCVDQGLAEGSDYLEFGVYRGFTLWYAQALIGDLGVRDMRCFGFDSFAGLPAPAGGDAVGEREAFYESAFDVRREEVERSLTRLGADWSRTALVEGFYDATLTPENRERLGLRRCSICVVDCDLYGSARLALAFVEPLVEEGTVILFDDWNSYGGDPRKGEQRAFSEFLARNPRLGAEPLLSFGGHGKGFVIHAR